MAVGAVAAISSLWRRRHARCSANVAGCGTTAGSRANSAGARQQLRVDHVGLVLARSPRRHPPLCVIRCPAPATRAHHQFPEPGSPERRARRPSLSRATTPTRDPSPPGHLPRPPYVTAPAHWRVPLTDTSLQSAASNQNSTVCLVAMAGRGPNQLHQQVASRPWWDHRSRRLR
jgi:hypothetical protein